MEENFKIYLRTFSREQNGITKSGGLETKRSKRDRNGGMFTTQAPERSRVSNDARERESITRACARVTMVA